MICDTEKIAQALAYIDYRLRDEVVDRRKACVLRWLADRYHIRCYGRTVTGAMDGDYNLEAISEEEIDQAPDLDVFSDSDLEALDLVCDTFGRLTTDELSMLANQFPEWKAINGLCESKDTDGSDRFFENPVVTAHSDLVAQVFNQSPERLDASREIHHLFRTK
ncbi:MAG: SocA family protein [Bacteroidales bacterium]|nr:SocA family protein [Bacteroidales bacterium]